MQSAQRERRIKRPSLTARRLDFKPDGRSPYLQIADFLRPDVLSARLPLRRPP
jgi:hypothetical protein